MVAPKYKCYFPFSWHSNITKMMAWTKGLLYDGLSPLLAWGMGWWDFLEGWDENDFGAGLLLVFLFLLLFSSLFISCSARSFFSKYRECQEDYHDGDIIRLSAITRREHMQSNELMTTLRWGFFLCSLPSLHWSVLELTAICLRLSLWTTSFLRFWAVQGFLFLSHFVFSAGAWWSATDKNIFFQSSHIWLGLWTLYLMLNYFMFSLDYGFYVAGHVFCCCSMKWDGYNSVVIAWHLQLGYDWVACNRSCQFSRFFIGCTSC